ncbi:MAG: hypothetical protein B7X12_03400 [Halothiobacillus sp. 20-53-49]|nr:MAG: hypothetical protein B7X12_03400 [Halothiobacillus sp. 20-53-49]
MINKALVGIDGSESHAAVIAVKLQPFWVIKPKSGALIKIRAARLTPGLIKASEAEMAAYLPAKGEVRLSWDDF